MLSSITTMRLALTIRTASLPYMGLRSPLTVLTIREPCTSCKDWRRNHQHITPGATKRREKCESRHILRGACAQVYRRSTRSWLSLREAKLKAVGALTSGGEAAGVELAISVSMLTQD